jgi:hypothetical protein
MKRFEFYVDRKITDWVREHHFVEAESYDEAVNKIVEDFKNGIDDMDSFDWQGSLEDVKQYMEPDDNDGMPTAELIDAKTNETIIDNIN